MRVLCIALALFGLATAISQQQFINDNHVFNYALTLENFEATLYGQVNRFPQAAFDAAGYPSGTRATILYIGNIENEHAQLLTGLVESRGWPAVANCSNYNFTSIQTVQQFVQTLALVEAVGAGAYDGAALAITDKFYLTIAAGIATIEARHTALLNAVAYNTTVGAFTPLLNSFNGSEAFNFTTVQGLIAPFFSGATCPTTSAFVPYLGSNYSVSSTNASSYQWASANSVRGGTPFTYAANPDAATNDISVLNYALTLEHLEATFYAAFASLYTPSNIQAAGFDAASANVIAANIQVIAAHEATHVAFLNQTITSFGQTPATPCAYNLTTFGLTQSSTFVQFLQVAALLENTGVTAYVGAISYIVNSDFTSVAASIATVEGEHAAYVANLLNNTGSAKFNPNPNVGAPVGQPGNTAINVASGQLDGATPPAAIQNAIGSILNCTLAQLGAPPAITATQFLNYFTDQGAFNTNAPSTTSNNAGTTTTPSTTSNGNAGTTTSNTFTSSTGSAAAVVASAAVVAAAMLF